MKGSQAPFCKAILTQIGCCRHGPSGCLAAFSALGRRIQPGLFGFEFWVAQGTSLERFKHSNEMSLPTGKSGIV